jgi:hypothetical protein
MSLMGKGWCLIVKSSVTLEVGNNLHILINESGTLLSLTDEAWRIHHFRD